MWLVQIPTTTKSLRCLSALLLKCSFLMLICWSQHYQCLSSSLESCFTYVCESCRPTFNCSADKLRYNHYRPSYLLSFTITQHSCKGESSSAKFVLASFQLPELLSVSLGHLSSFNCVRKKLPKSVLTNFRSSKQHPENAWNVRGIS